MRALVVELRATKLPVSQRNRSRPVSNEPRPQPQCARRTVRASPGEQRYAHTDIPDSRHRGRCRMKAIVVTDQAAGTAGVKLVERPEPQAAINDVVVQIHASGFTGDELTWPSTWTDRVGRDRTPSIPGHELAGVVTAF